MIGDLLRYSNFGSFEVSQNQNYTVINLIQQIYFYKKYTKNIHIYEYVSIFLCISSIFVYNYLSYKTLKVFSYYPVFFETTRPVVQFHSQVILIFETHNVSVLILKTIFEEMNYYILSSRAHRFL